MLENVKADKLTAKDRLVARMLRWSPWLAFLLLSLPAPLIFFFLWLISTSIEMAAIYILLAAISFLIGSVAGIIAVIFLILYRKRWEKRIRERLAADGVTASELSWFMSELTTAERQALKTIEGQNALLGDAYRETLATRLTASRVLASAKRELLLVERRINRATLLQGTDTASLQEELRADYGRLERVRQEGAERLAEAQARLQMIEAAASRGASFAETDFALKRLGAGREQVPLGLEVARLEHEAREEAERELRESKPKDRNEEGMRAEG
jgi:hypothetical protein